MFVFNSDKKKLSFIGFVSLLEHMYLISAPAEMLLLLLKFAASEWKMKRTKQLMSICPGFVFL